MTTPEIFNLIGSYGFPIIACMALFYFVQTTLKTMQQTIIEMKKTVEQNTAVMNTLVNLLSKDD